MGPPEGPSSAHATDRRETEHRADGGEPTPRATGHAMTDAEGRRVAVRPYDDESFDALVTMYERFDPKQRAQGLPPLATEEIRDWLTRLLTGPSMLAWHDGRVVGHVVFVPDGEGSHELAVFVHQAYQRAGVGTALVRAGLSDASADGVTDVWLWVERWKEGSRAFYRQLGFTEEGRRGLELRMSQSLPVDTEQR
jgi:ribosomal protein S18 acetylase RimI-like enzyme